MINRAKGLQLCCGLFVFILTANAQQFGGHPPSQKWKQINTDTARIIFPAKIDSQAMRIAAIVHELARKTPLNPGIKQNKIDIILQNHTTIANGYVGLGPFRSEFYLTPSSGSLELGSIPWIDQLAVHEYRHVQQYSHFRQGISNLLYYLFGEDGLALWINAAVPGWYYEGDAVYAETFLSKQGRGRLPGFLNDYKAIWLDDKDYSWMKLRNGSLRDFVPSEYHLGYFMVVYGRKEYGENFWEKVTRDAAAFKGLFYPFQKAVKRHAGIRYKEFINDAFQFYKTKTTAEKNQIIGQHDSAVPGNEYIEPVSKQTNNYVTNYKFPFFIGNDSLLFLKSSYRERPAFFIKTGEKEMLVRYKDIGIDEYFSYHNNKIIYTAYNPDSRWGWRDYSDIRLLDITTGLQKNITQKSKYFWPDISEDGSLIVAMHLPTDLKNELHLLDVHSSDIIHAYTHPEITVFTDPKFINNDEVIAAARYRNGTMNLVRINFTNNQLQNITPATYHVVGNPYVENDIIYFTASYSDNDDLYAVSLKDEKVYQVTDAALGKYNVNAADSSLYFSGFTTEGYQLQKLTINKQQWKELNQQDLLMVQNNLLVATNDSLGSFLQQVPQRKFSIQDYSKSTGLLNFHSWRPYYEDPIFSFSVFGENVLNTLQSELFYQYNQNDNDHAVGFNSVYGGLFPYLSAGVQFTFDRQVEEGSGMRQFHQLDSRAGFNIPLNLTSGRSYKFLNFGSSYVLRNEFNTGNSKGMPANDLSYLSHFINWNQQVPQALQHIFPRLGYSLTAQHRHAITSIEGYQFFTNGNIYLPGFARVHHIVFSGSFQQRDTLRQLFSNRMAFSRGYNDPYFSRMWRTSANYHLPLLYPDKGVGNILYLQRIRTNFFFDYSRVFSRDKMAHADYRSTGIELFFDTKWWNEYPLSFGVRYSRLLDRDLLAPGISPNQWEVILPVTIIPR